MTKLAACPSCSPHVRINEPQCPFCAHGLAGAFDDRPAPLAVVGRFSRAALFVLGATAAAAGTTLACESDDGDDGSIVALYGIPPTPGKDAGPDDDSGSTAALYGLPAPPPDAGTN